jgi:hypothetical protein
MTADASTGFARLLDNYPYYLLCVYHFLANNGYVKKLHAKKKHRRVISTNTRS